MDQEPITREYLREQLKEQAGELRADMKQQIDGLRTELRGDMKQQIDGLRTELRGEMHAMEGRLRGEMHVMEGRLRGEMKDMEGRLRGEMHAMEGRLLKEVGHALSVGIEQVGKMIGFVDDKYKELPTRTDGVRHDLDEHRDDWRIHKKPPQTPPKRPRAVRVGK
ncbi:MAG: hypothetical protein HY698_02715 [Deltaproteobacteria bacterium]|nr:hypothetical protein [Deltaproteobacteria bacterium]